MTTLVGIIILILAFIAMLLMWVAASIYDESKRIEERTAKVIMKRMQDLRNFYCPECGELLDPVDPGDDLVEQYYCDCGWYDQMERNNGNWNRR